MERQSGTKQLSSHKGITQISVSGYKCIGSERTIEIRPLTILAGANSSGKSSAMQPLLLLKQTLEAGYDPGALLLNGPNVRFTSADQLLSHARRDGRADMFSVGIRVGTDKTVTTYFMREPNKGFEIHQMVSFSGGKSAIFRLGMPNDEITSILPAHLKSLTKVISEGRTRYEWTVVRNRCFLDVALKIQGSMEGSPFAVGASPGAEAESSIRELIHLPGLRGNPERTYPVTAVGSTFPGPFENYAASVISQWQGNKNNGSLDDLNADLERLGLTWKVTAKPIDDTQVELQVGRLTHAVRGGAWDLVNIADVGFGVSRTLPVLVALHAAKPGQLVYLEQPEIHLHPRAQSSMAEVLADVAKRGIRVVAETHSSLLLVGIQTLVAEGKLPAESVILHWFKRREDGTTDVTSTNLDERGAFGEWPEDFADVALQAENRYLNAAESRARYG